MVGLNLDALIEQEEKPGLGNGGLGRLAACYLDSLATLEVPAIGYGIRYEFGIFDQAILDGWQIEMTDKWLRLGHPWEIARPQVCYYVNLGGYTEAYHDRNGQYGVRWIPHRVVKGMAHDVLILGYQVEMTNLLRLWKAEACESFDFEAFNDGDYYGAVTEKVRSENITKVLYPNDNLTQGKQLRLEQQYFFVSCSLQDMLRMHLEAGSPLEEFHRSFAVQLNDTHPAIDSISSGLFSKGDQELFRPLVDLLLTRDEYLLLADYQSYLDCQDEVSRAFRDQTHWTRMAVLNVARMGRFSSDRAIREYCDRIWSVSRPRRVGG